MNNEETMDQALRDSLKKLAKRCGGCPSAEDLVAYQSGELGPTQTAVLHDHVLLCATCELNLERLNEADRVTAPAVVEEPAGEAHPWMRVFWNPAIAYTLALILVYPAYRGIFSHGTVELPATVSPLPVALAPVQVFELAQDRKASSRDPALVLRQGEDRFVVSFFVPTRPGYRYFAELRDAKGRTVGEKRELATSRTSNVSLSCDAGILHSGAYKLTVTEWGRQGESASSSFDYAFELRLPGTE
ncbi:MAG: hypothetical protein ABI693_00525 [Bryobacteraceae bacterium]